VLTFFIGLWLGSPLYWLIGVVIHFPMRVIASKDHNFFRIYPGPFDSDYLRFRCMPGRG